MSTHEVTHYGTSRDGFPTFTLGHFILSDTVTTEIVVNQSRKNGLSRVGGYQFAISLDMPLTWDEAESYGFSRAHLIDAWDRHEKATLQLLLPDLNEEKLSMLGCRVVGNSKATAVRDDLHLLVLCAPTTLWGEKGDIARGVDDARKPELIAHDALHRAGVSIEMANSIVTEMYPPKK